MRAYQGYSPGVDYGCFDLMHENALVSFLLGFGDTVNYTEPIVLSLPAAPTSTAPPNTQQPSTATASGRGATHLHRLSGPAGAGSVGARALGRFGREDGDHDDHRCSALLAPRP